MIRLGQGLFGQRPVVFMETSVRPSNSGGAPPSATWRLRPRDLTDRTSCLFKGGVHGSRGGDVVLAEDATLPEDFAGIAPRSDPGVAPLSFGQEGLWLFQQLYPDNTALSILRTLRAAKPLVRSVLESSLTEIVRRHEILRTNFRVIDGRPMQVIRPPEPVSVGLFDFSDLSPSERKRELVRWLRKRSSEPF